MVEVKAAQVRYRIENRLLKESIEDATGHGAQACGEHLWQAAHSLESGGGEQGECV
jgi:hypothetical protein